MITCDKCGFGHKTFEEKRACKSWDEIAAELKAVPAATQEQPAGSKRCDECEWHGCAGREHGCGCKCHVMEMIAGQAKLEGVEREPAGSGALREALGRMYKKAVLRGWQCAADAECRAAMEQASGALSLSNPIESAQPLNQRAWDLIRHQRMELHAAGLITDEEYAALARDHDAVYRLENYDKVMAQASSEVRELRDGLECAEYALSHPESNQQFALTAVRLALAPSRQGAAKRVEG